MANRGDEPKDTKMIEAHHLHLKETQSFQRFLFPWFFFLQCNLYYMKIAKDQGKGQSTHKVNKDSAKAL